MLELGLRQTGLNLGVTPRFVSLVSRAEPLLPMLPTRRFTPDEELATAQLGGRHQGQPVTARVECHLPAPLLGWEIEEEVGRLRVAGRPAGVDAVEVSGVGAGHGSVVVGDVGRADGGKHPRPFGLRDSRVGPPVHGNGVLVRVTNPHGDEDDR